MVRITERLRSRALYSLRLFNGRQTYGNTTHKCEWRTYSGAAHKNEWRTYNSIMDRRGWQTYSNALDGNKWRTCGGFFDRNQRRNLFEESNTVNWDINSQYYYNAYGKIHRDDRCTYQEMDIMESLLPGVSDQKNPWETYKQAEILDDIYPLHADYLIIGGGIMGASVAYWLGKFHVGSNIVVLEKDTTFTQASTVLSVGGIRQQFGIEENIKMSLFGAEFLRDIHRNLSVYGKHPVQVNFNPQGYLFLASEEGAALMEEMHRLQRQCGARVALYSPAKLKDEFPWLNVDDVALGSYGLENEGWFDPWSLLNGMKQNAASNKIHFVQGDVVGFMFKPLRETHGKDQIKQALVRKKNGKIQPIDVANFVNCAGAWSGDLARLMKIGIDDEDNPEDIRTIRLPVEKRKRYVYAVHCPDGPGINCPMVIDTTGLYFRREGLGGLYLVGMSPHPDEEPPTDNLDVDYDYFYDKIWPLLASRVPAFESCKVKNAWAGYYDYNYFDENCVIGNHPYYDNVYFCTGFSGHGIQQAPAAGLCLAELLLHEQYDTIDLSRFDFRRFLVGAPMLEPNIV